MKKSRKIIQVFLFAAAAIILVGTGGESPRTDDAHGVQHPVNMSKDIPSAPPVARDLIA